MPDFSLEDAIAGPVAGMDEAGRGPWAGPVVAAAVILDRNACPEGLNDSKQLSAKRREALFEALEASAQIGIGLASVAEIDRLNILGANDLAMCRAVEDLITPDPDRAAARPHPPPGAQRLCRDRGCHVLIDGNRVPRALGLAASAIVKGDGRSLSIAAASIIAKVTRDRIMADLAARYPGYGWETNKGYGTRAHAEALLRLGVTEHHRRSFKPIHKMLC